MSRWLSVDSDDLCHLPRNRGHPTRSREVLEDWRTTGYAASESLLAATDRFIDWVESGPEVTVFLLAEQLDCPHFTTRLARLLELPNLTFACHGWGHRCWSAWPADPAGFAAMLEASHDRISTFTGAAWRPWFRAPGGYIADWMAAPLAAAGFTVDSSVNPTRWVARKMVPSAKAVTRAMAAAGIEERPWATSVFGPACGPALSLPPFSLFAPRVWQRTTANLYWHLLDHRRNDGMWAPPYL